ncbi:MAG: HD family hydrolase [Vicinamibacterales bacterium]
MADLQPIVDFVLELDKLKGVTRRTQPLGLTRYENAAEHSWQIAMLALSLAHLAAGPVDVDRVVRMLLVHDVGEIDTGDTIVYATEGVAERKAAERAGALRVLGLLPEAQRGPFIELWEEFEAEVTAESRFANAVDRAMPVLLNLANNGQSWRENGIRHEQVVTRVGPQVKAGCPALWDYLEARLADAHARGWFTAA